MLLSWNCRPEVVGSGTEVFAQLMAALGRDPYGLVLLDQEMPGISGLEMAWVIKGAPQLASVPLVLLTSVGSPGERPEGGLFFAKLSKPLRRLQLHKALSAAVAVSGSDPSHSPADGTGVNVLSLDLRILLVEDNDVNRRVAIGLVERLGCRAHAFENGREALEALDHDRYDLILMDVQMPEMDGLEATAAIRAREQGTGRHIPIVAMTAHAMTGDRENCLAAGMDGYLSKPLRPGPLREALAHWSAADRPPAVAAEPAPPPRVEQSWSADSLRESCGDDPALISEVVGLMLKGTPARLDRLAAAITAKDGRQVSWEAHALKGAFQTVGAEALALACQELIALGERGDFPTIESTHAGVRDQWDRLREEAGGYLLRGQVVEVGGIE
jgi:CheY-like chemotaxis protein/HPt (histidine-containing phosphotransfer) domain-containing protein